MGTVLKMTGIVALGVLLAALLWLFGASDAFASTDPMSALEQQLRTPSDVEKELERALQTPSPDTILLEKMLKQQQEGDERDHVLQLFFPDLHFLEPAMLSEADLKRELAELEEEE